MKLSDYFPEFSEALRYQLLDDQERWGDEWKKRPIESSEDWDHQNVRIFVRIAVYYAEWRDKGKPMPWLKIAGLAFIGWTRENNPDYDKDSDVD